jgi:hypothetical protein
MMLGASDRIAAQTISVPRPSVNVNPWPVCSPSVSKTRYAHE